MVTGEAIALIVLVAQIWDDNNPHVPSAPSARLLISIKCYLHNVYSNVTYNVDTGPGNGLVPLGTNIKISRTFYQAKRINEMRH